MEQAFGLLEIQGPDGEIFAYQLHGDHVTIGRGSHNDLNLEAFSGSPDGISFVSRDHCILDRYEGTWWARDRGSRNKTLIRRDDRVDIVAEPTPLADGDVIRILGKIEDETRFYWELTFHDPGATRPAFGEPEVTFLEYDWIEARLYRTLDGRREEIVGLRPQEHKLIRYMFSRNREHGRSGVMCTYQELMAAIWDEDPGLRSYTEVNHVVSELRQKIEPSTSEPRFLVLVPKLGYRLVTHPPVEASAQSSEEDDVGSVPQ